MRRAGPDCRDVKKTRSGFVLPACCPCTACLTYPALAERFEVEDVPTLVLVRGRRVLERLEGRVSVPRIEEMLDTHLGEPLFVA